MSIKSSESHHHVDAGTCNNRRLGLASRAGSLFRHLSTRNMANANGAGSVFASATSSNPSRDAALANLHIETATSHVENGEWSLALRFYNLALILQRRAYGQDSAQAATTLNCIGICHMNMSRPDCLRFSECALREARWIREQRFGRTSDEVAEVEANLELLLGDSWDDVPQDVTKRTTMHRRTSDGTSDTGFISSSTASVSSSNDSSSSRSSSSSTSSDNEEQIEFDYRGPNTFVDVELSASPNPNTAATNGNRVHSSGSSTAEDSVSSSSHSTRSFGDDEEEDNDRPSPSAACAVLFADIL